MQISGHDFRIFVFGHEILHFPLVAVNMLTLSSRFKGREELITLNRRAKGREQVQRRRDFHSFGLFLSDWHTNHEQQYTHRATTSAASQFIIIH
jgi:hypothetical protein